MRCTLKYVPRIRSAIYCIYRSDVRHLGTCPSPPTVEEHGYKSKFEISGSLKLSSEVTCGGLPGRQTTLWYGLHDHGVDHQSAP